MVVQAGVDALDAGHRQYTNHAVVLEQSAQPIDLAGLVRGHPRCGHPGLERSGEHAYREVGVGGEPDVVGDAGFARGARPVVPPRGGWSSRSRKVRPAGLA
jgi:hypothetical protein